MSWRAARSRRPPCSSTAQACPGSRAARPGRRTGPASGYAYGFNSLFQIAAHPEPIDFGSSILADGATDLPTIVLHMAWGPMGPSTDTAGSLLFQGNVVGETEGIYLTTEGGTTAGKLLVSHESYDSIKGLAWLPDGSGFVYSVTDNELLDEPQSNVYRYDLARGEATRVTDLTGEFAGMSSVSPDGRTVVFERADEVDVVDASLGDPDLWLIGLDGSEPRLLVEDARAPAWSW